jgi:very-short-patch-repair endonuclease
MREFVSRIDNGSIAASSAVDQFQAAYYQALMRDLFRTHRDLAEFDGRSFEQRIEEFRDLDLNRIEIARGEVATAHYDAMPRHASGGEMAIIRREIEKKRKHRPIRQLIKEAGTAILAIKPVFMMSPISVAQYLEPGGVTFELLLIDEASQVSPVDALGAIARASQVVVVGDDKQLPPTRFFSKMLDDDETAGDPDELDAGDIESILGLCVAQGMSQRMLRWHYRSRHHSLIAVSNREFYESRLHVVPSPTTITPMHGLHFRPVEGGVFDRGNSATNRVEARAIAEAVIEHARRSPDSSLGVGAFSVAQRDAIRDELEVLQREHVDLSPFFATRRSEPFFVKNLENIQGDERDVIFISVGYARDGSGYMAMNFGPLSTEGGERRLNVLITRARERCEVFSSITADDIDLERARSRGAAAFKTFLRYAATGILDTQAPTGGAYDSDFELQVAVELERLGFKVDRQVGTAGFVIDLAIVDPTTPGRYLLGIECDGATYHSSRSARDRDRLREAVLRDRGWKIHRVWSTDWFHRPGEQLQKVVAAIEKARLEWISGEPAREPSGDDRDELEIPDAEIERGTELESTNGEPSFAWTIPYEESRQRVPDQTPIADTSPRVLERIVTAVVRVEGPIHKEEIARRVTSLWGLQRTGPRIAEAVAKAVDAGLRSGALRADSDFVTPSELAVVQVRNRAAVAAANLRKPEMIPPSEVRQAVLHLVNQHVGLRRDELPLLVVKALGFKVTSPKLKDLIDKVLASMLENGDISARDQKLFVH